MMLFKYRPICGDAVPGRDTHWRTCGLVFDPERTVTEIKRIECREIIYTSREETEDIALTLCKAWVDGLGAAVSESNYRTIEVSA